MKKLLQSLTFALLLAPVAAAAPAPAAPATTTPLTTTTAKADAPLSNRPLLFVAMTGLEDVQRLQSVFMHAKVAADQHKLNDVSVLVYGRAAEVFNGAIKTRPAALLDAITAAQAAGVKVMVCNVALDRMGIDPAKAVPTPTQIVPNGMTTLVEYVLKDAAVISY